MGTKGILGMSWEVLSSLGREEEQFPAYKKILKSRRVGIFLKFLFSSFLKMSCLGDVGLRSPKCSGCVCDNTGKGIGTGWARLLR